jgi:hypothetical protein
MAGPGREGPDDMPVVDVRVGTGDVWVWPVVARIWRTVDVERTVAQLGLAAEPIERDEVLGGQGVLVRPPGELPVAILEPFTEGRLAASLARNGEGDAGWYAAPPGGLEEARRTGEWLGPEATGPFGRSALSGPRHLLDAGPLTVIVESPPATIDG